MRELTVDAFIRAWCSELAKALANEPGGISLAADALVTLAASRGL